MASFSSASVVLSTAAATVSTFPSSASFYKNPSLPILAKLQRRTSPLSWSTPTSTSTSTPSFDLRVYWAELITQIDAQLSKSTPIQYPESINESMRYSLLCPGAKRAPPVMCIATACDLLGATQEAAYPTACALEMVHAASLVHDDLPCMDAAPLRRGRPTNHSVFGTEIALLAGDALFPHAFRHIASKTPYDLVSEETILRVITEIARAVGSKGMATGQLLDLGHNTGVTDVMEVLERKFGEMAECSAVCGGLLGGAEGEVLECLRRYGRVVGVLYQVVDDILMEEGDNGEKMRSNASVVGAYGMERALEIMEELRVKAKTEINVLSHRFGAQRVLALDSFVDFAVGRDD